MHLQSRLRLGTAMLAISLAAGSLSACTTMEKGWTSTKDAVGGLFGGNDDKAAPPDQTAEAEAAPAPEPAPMTGGLFMGNQSAASAFQTTPSQPSAPAEQAAAPEEKPAPKKPEPKKSEPKKAAKPEPKEPEKVDEPALDSKKEEPAKPPKNVEGLVADTEKAAYTETSGRRAPVTVRPLNENAQTAEASAPPRPAAAPVEQVSRLQGDLAPATPAAPAATPASSAPPPRAAELAERLDAPAPTPGAGIPDAPVRAPVPTAPAEATPQPSQVAAVPPAPSAPIQALIPTAPSSSIVGYGDDTVVVDSSGTKGGRNVLGSRSSFDPGNASVSSEVGSVSFAPGSSALSAQGKAILADAARLRAQTDGAIRVVGRGDQAAARAAAVSKELRRLGVPAARLYDGGADSTMLGDAADIYLDY